MKSKNQLKKEWHKQCRKKALFCYLCGQLILKESEISVEHVKPRSMGGKDTQENMQPAHSLCNNIRDTMPIETFRFILNKVYDGNIKKWWGDIHQAHLIRIYHHSTHKKEK